jgi:hypothetical protein
MGIAGWVGAVMLTITTWATFGYVVYKLGVAARLW